MASSETLKILQRLEQYRLKLISGELTPGTHDHTVRMCQAIAAERIFDDRATWVKILKKRSAT